MSGRDRLSEATLRGAKGATLPAYDRRRVTTGVVHLGVGAFHRAHQAVYIDDCLAAGEAGWGIVGASLRSTDTRDALAPQDGLYTLAEQDSSGEKLRVVGSIKELVVAPENPEALVARMAAPTTRIVSLTVTEKAYLRDRGGDLDLAHPDIVHDLAEPQRPRTTHGFIAAALERRRKEGAAPFTVLCCDNLPANGETLRRLILQFAAARGGDLARYVEQEVAFPSTMVDRIVPATTDEDRERISRAIGLADAWPVKTEPFMQWVVEDRFTAGRPRWEKFGVTMVGDVRPFEEMKLRLLNGAHSGIAYLGLLCGRRSVSEAFSDPEIRGFVDRLWAEAIPTLPKGAGLDPQAYVTALARRFANTALVHRTAQIAMDGSQKLPQRILAAARGRLAEGRPAAHLMLVVAAWIACCEARGTPAMPESFTDPLDDRLAAVLVQRGSPEETVRRVFEAAGFGAVTGEAAGPLAGIAARFLGTIRESGARAAIEQAMREEETE
ncbi:mannitol dehydrogenase family protein [Aquamicrobium sp. LC103]|uniref:mannitol dehydrogenase family protein n=1 Tax=Aquamicrobium sp. LC103 TaxID=1120658 RepID=UPI00063E73D0|nr:mannitol dehydrogenase family protein [Aquamicrobium sp. LC103]TKT74643.1 mannitol dehydrogenase family protein [Aquamicrobium sp. LC103]